MSQLQWLADWATGFQDIDEQHQQLIEQVAQLKSARDTHDSMQIMQALFDFIASAMNHFSYEEEMLKEAEYKLADIRHQTHQNFIDRLISYQDKIFEDLSVLDELLPQIEVWLHRHITLNDKAYIDSVKQSGIYRQDNQGNWVRPSVPVQGAMQDEEHHMANDAAQADGQQDEDDNAPRGWASTF